MLSQIKRQAPLLVVPSPSIPSSFSLETILLPEPQNFEFSSGVNPLTLFLDQ